MVTTRSSTSSSTSAVTPLHLTKCASPALPQELCPLFTTIPGEIRDRIFSLALADYEDKTRLYDDITCYKRPNYFAPRRTDTNLLRTCQRVYREAWFLPWTNKEHTFWLTENSRMPPEAQVGEEWRDPQAKPWETPFNAAYKFRRTLQNLAENVQKTHGSVPTINCIRLFAQLYMLEPGDMLQYLLDVPLFLPLHITLTLRHADWWHWEEDHVLRIAADWVNKCKFPVSVKEIRLELESLSRKKNQIDSIAEQMASQWTFHRADGVKLIAQAPSPINAATWQGISAWGGVRWLRDESQPGQLDYYVATVIWHPESTSNSNVANQLETSHAPMLTTAVGAPLPRMPGLLVAKLEEAGIGMDLPREEVIRRMVRAEAALRARMRAQRRGLAVANPTSQ